MRLSVDGCLSAGGDKEMEGSARPHRGLRASRKAKGRGGWEMRRRLRVVGQTIYATVMATHTQEHVFFKDVSLCRARPYVFPIGAHAVKRVISGSLLSKCGSC